METTLSIEQTSGEGCSTKRPMTRREFWGVLFCSDELVKTGVYFK
jgi:hypothetical protein